MKKKTRMLKDDPKESGEVSVEELAAKKAAAEEELDSEQTAAEEKSETEQALSEETLSREEKQKAMEEDIALFRSLFEDVKAEQIPQEVWERVEKGESLSASFALYTLQKAKEQERVERVNLENAKKAPPKLRHDGAEQDYFSPEAVRAMSRSEIKKHYGAILKSMEKWN